MSQHQELKEQTGPDGYTPSPAVQDILDLCQRILESQRQMIEAMEEIAAYVRPESEREQ